MPGAIQMDCGRDSSRGDDAKQARWFGSEEVVVHLSLSLSPHWFGSETLVLGWILNSGGFGCWQWWFLLLSSGGGSGVLGLWVFGIWFIGFLICFFFVNLY